MEPANFNRLCASVLAGAWVPPVFFAACAAPRPRADIFTVIREHGRRHHAVFGLRVCPDLDTVMYTLGAGNQTKGRQAGGVDAETLGIRGRARRVRG